jgi:hypothetical protein
LLPPCHGRVLPYMHCCTEALMAVLPYRLTAECEAGPAVPIPGMIFCSMLLEAGER